MGYSQNVYFEYHNPNAIALTPTVINQIKSTEWFAFNITTIIRSDTIETEVHHSLTYDSSKFKFGRCNGIWRIVQNNYIKHEGDTNGICDNLKFGGIYCVTELTDTSMVLEKLQTSTHDMKRSIQFGNKMSGFEGTSLDNPTNMQDIKLHELKNIIGHTYILDSSTGDSIYVFSLENAFMRQIILNYKRPFIINGDTLYPQLNEK
ncbi:MAG: hypothetical protein JKY33_00200 [Bacteroidia bacterium]|nr:hypothetical protein [Bacteroidia bacterium]